MDGWPARQEGSKQVEQEEEERSSMVEASSFF
jgi:hypothetical protein